MASLFPGMDPFIEQQEWEDFHSRFNIALADKLSAVIEPSYFARVERRIYMERLAAEDFPEIEPRVFWKKPDVAVRFTPDAGDSLELESDGGVAVAEDELEPFECLLIEPVEHRESYLVIRESGSGEIVTVIETLSPSNKRPNSIGREEYLSKRVMTHGSPVHLVEFDLLRGGERLPMQSLPPGDYYALVSRRRRRPRVDVYAWPMQRRMPSIRIPLKPEDPEPKLDLQAAFDTVYENARYQLSIDYRRELNPPVAEESAEWLTGVLENAKGRVAK